MNEMIQWTILFDLVILNFFLIGLKKQQEQDQTEDFALGLSSI